MATARQEGRWVSAILFCDFRGFSRLRDEHFPVFVKNVLGTLGAEFDCAASEVLWRNSWGDAIAAVFADVTSAAQCALGLHDALARIDLDELRLPPPPPLRVAPPPPRTQ